MGRRLDASALLRSSLRLPALSIALAFACRALAQTEVAGAQAQLPRADLGPTRELVRAGKLEEADAALGELQKTFPDDASLLLLRGEVLIAVQKPGDAIPLLQHAASIAPQKPRVQFNLGTALASSGDSAGALAAFAKEIENNPDPQLQVLARINRSILFQKEKKPTDAAAEIETVLQLEPVRGDAYFDLIDLYLELGRPDDAARTIDRGTAVGAKSARSYYRVGAAYFNQKAAEKAVPYFQQALETQPDLAQAELALARSLDQLAKGSEADAHFRRYLELRPDAPEGAEIRKRLKLPAAG